MKLPKGCEDLLPLVKEAARIRKDFFMRHNKRDQHHWRNAWEQLCQSRNPIYIQKTGANAGNVVKGMPKKIKNEVLQILTGIAMRGFDEDRDKFPSTSAEGVGIENTNEVTLRRYRDSKYAMLAVLYSNQTMQVPTWVYRTTVVAEAGVFTDLPIEYDYRYCPPPTLQYTYSSLRDVCECNVLMKVALLMYFHCSGRAHKVL